MPNYTPHIEVLRSHMLWIFGISYYGIFNIKLIPWWLEDLIYYPRQLKNDEELYQKCLHFPNNNNDAQWCNLQRRSYVNILFRVCIWVHLFGIDPYCALFIIWLDSRHQNILWLQISLTIKFKYVSGSVNVWIFPKIWNLFFLQHEIYCLITSRGW